MWMLRSKIITINNDYIALKLFKFDIINSYLYTSHCPRSKITIGFWHIYYPFISIRILRSTAQANSFSLKSCIIDFILNKSKKHTKLHFESAFILYSVLRTP